MTFAIETELESVFDLLGIKRNWYFEGSSLDRKSATLELGGITSICHLPSLAFYLLNTSSSDCSAFYFQLALGTGRVSRRHCKQ